MVLVEIIKLVVDVDGLGHSLSDVNVDLTIGVVGKFMCLRTFGVRCVIINYLLNLVAQHVQSNAERNEEDTLRDLPLADRVHCAQGPAHTDGCADLKLKPGTWVEVSSPAIFRVSIRYVLRWLG